MTETHTDADTGKKWERVLKGRNNSEIEGYSVLGSGIPIGVSRDGDRWVLERPVPTTCPSCGQVLPKAVSPPSAETETWVPLADVKTERARIAHSAIGAEAAWFQLYDAIDKLPRTRKLPIEAKP